MRRDGQKRVHAPQRREHAERATGKREQKSFRQELAYEPAAFRA